MSSDGEWRPRFVDPPKAFPVEPGKTRINSGLDSVTATMQPGERRVVIVPAALGYAGTRFYPTEAARQRRFVISPETMLVYEVDALANE